jgi:hypothetical protein
MCQPVQFGFDERDQLLNRTGVSVTPLKKQLGDLLRWKTYAIHRARGAVLSTGIS